MLLCCRRCFCVLEIIYDLDEKMIELLLTHKHHSWFVLCPLSLSFYRTYTKSCCDLFYASRRQAIQFDFLYQLFFGLYSGLYLYLVLCCCNYCTDVGIPIGRSPRSIINFCHGLFCCLLYLHVHRVYWWSSWFLSTVSPLLWLW